MIIHLINFYQGKQGHGIASQKTWHRRKSGNIASQEKKSHDGMENRNGIAIAKTCDVNCDAMPCNLQILKFITYGN